MRRIGLTAETLPGIIADHPELNISLPDYPIEPTMRAAIYFTPPDDAELTRAAAVWLGRDAFTGGPTREPDPDLDPRVAAPARYGFHATVKAPFRLAEGCTLADLTQHMAVFCAARQSFRIDRVAIDRLGAFFAFVAAPQPTALNALEEAVVREFDVVRAPASRDEIARRQPERLSRRQRQNLEKWGYPYVMDEFRFHMTLTGPIAEADQEVMETTLKNRFARFDGVSLPVDRLALFVEPEPGAPFVVHSVHPFAPPAESLS
ncbi:DUF1045 domain-containing protein [Consotaella aegiceratis]|uniref:DUF1045 domain-containing protein n=1 Tax=Consotaella aegiceratis TaxID=3097961 RepID=UPI002F429F6F